MPIKVQCDGCGARLTVNDKMAGKSGQCPKCARTLSIPAGVAGGAAGAGTESTWGKNVRTPLDDLLDEAGVKAVSNNPTCPSCGADVAPEAVMCIECGFNFTSGRQVRTMAFDGGVNTAGMTESQKIMAKAERDIQREPITFDEGDHGDGPDSFLVALGMLVVFGILVALGIATVFVMDKVTTDSRISLVITNIVSTVLVWIGFIWILIVAFMEGVGHGVGCLLCWIYVLIYGFSRFGSMWIPTCLYTIGTTGSIITSIMLGFTGG